MKKILLAICLVFLFATCSLAGDLIFSPIIEKPAPGETDTYIVTKDNGQTETVHVMSLDKVSDDTYAVIDSNGNTTIVTKWD
ncbi:MAG: hypothetical protein H8D55_02490 [Deltaproteobacteria bacterium]|nr:hypothetical protein [Deltaproteobacteria bacterium]MBL7217178.1 hypothetical protein [Desulfobacteraceae bacterium]